MNSKAPGWEWVLATGGSVTASIDPATGFESIYVGRRLVSRASAGTKPDGHPVVFRPREASDGYRHAAPTVVVTYDPARGDFELRANGQVVAPTSAPMMTSAAAPPAYQASLPPRAVSSSNAKSVLVVALLLAGIVGTLSAVKLRKPTAPPAGEVQASNGLVRVHYPAGFIASAEKEKGPAANEVAFYRSSWLSARHHQRDEAFFVLSVASGQSLGRDPWVVSNALYKNFAKTIEEKMFQHQASLTENDRQEQTCVGNAGAVVVSTFGYEGERGTFWTCTFLRGKNAYMIGYTVNAKVAADEASLRAALERTELLE